MAPKYINNIEQLEIESPWTEKNYTYHTADE